MNMANGVKVVCNIKGGRGLSSLPSLSSGETSSEPSSSESVCDFLVCFG